MDCFIPRFLHTDDITKTAVQNQYVKKYFTGTYPADVVPTNIRKICCWVWNTDESSQTGQHWVGFFKHDKNLIYFDSYGSHVNYYNRNTGKNLQKEKNGNLSTIATFKDKVAYQLPVGHGYCCFFIKCVIISLVTTIKTIY